MNVIPPGQQALRDRCAHPTGAWQPFPPAESQVSAVARFEAQARAHAGRPAISVDGRQVTYAELDATANRVANALLREAGDRAEPVALFFEHGAPMIAALLGVLKAGKFYVALSLQDPPARQAQILEDSTARLIVCDAASAPLAARLPGTARVLELDALVAHGAPVAPGLRIPFEAYAYLIYTSGTTGAPKGVIETHADVLHFTRVWTNYYRVCPEDRITLLATLAFSAASGLMYGTLLNGACVCPYDVRAHGVEGLPAYIRREALTIYDCVPALLRRLPEVVPAGESFPSLRVMATGGDRLYREDVARIGRFLEPHCLFRNSLGTSEVKHVAAFFMDPGQLPETEIVPAGYVVPDTRVLVCDADGRELPPGKVGEIRIAGRYMSPGYWRRPDLTAAAFVPDPEGAGGRVYRTGDLGCLLPDGALMHVGRADSQVKVRGYRIELSEVESALRAIEGVDEAVVIARGRDGAELSLHAYVTLRAGAPPTASAIRARAHGRLPAYMAPATVTVLAALPLNDNGKVDRRALRDRPDREPAAATPPRTALEARLCALWRDRLGIERLGVHDDVFELGATSVQALALLARLQPLFGDAVTPELLLEAPTVAELAARLEAAISPRA